MDASYEALRRLGTIVLAAEPLDAVLAQVARTARDAIEPAEDVSLTLIEGDRGFTAAHTGQLSLDADEMQYANGHGPCLDAGRGGVTLVISDMCVEERWPAYAPLAAGRGVRSSLSVPLPVQSEVIGGLNVYATRPHAFDDPDVIALAEEVATYAAVAIANARGFADAADRAHHMAQAMSSRAVIEQAKGIVMATQRCTAEEAFTVLTRASQQRNRKLRDVAAELVTATSRGD